MGSSKARWFLLLPVLAWPTVPLSHAVKRFRAAARGQARSARGPGTGAGARTRNKNKNTQFSSAPTAHTKIGRLGSLGRPSLPFAPLPPPFPFVPFSLPGPSHRETCPGAGSASPCPMPSQRTGSGRAGCRRARDDHHESCRAPTSPHVLCHAPIMQASRRG
jgi:hypothetical protein